MYGKYRGRTCELCPRNKCDNMSLKGCPKFKCPRIRRHCVKRSFKVINGQKCEVCPIDKCAINRVRRCPKLNCQQDIPAVCVVETFKVINGVRCEVCPQIGCKPCTHVDCAPEVISRTCRKENFLEFEGQTCVGCPTNKCNRGYPKCPGTVCKQSIAHGCSKRAYSTYIRAWNVKYVQWINVTRL